MKSLLIRGILGLCVVFTMAAAAPASADAQVVVKVGPRITTITAIGTFITAMVIGTIATTIGSQRQPEMFRARV